MGHQRSVAHPNFNQSKSLGLSEIKHRNNKICIAARRVHSKVEQTPKHQCSPQLNKLECFVTASPETGTPIFGLHWFNDRAWPTVPQRIPRPRQRSGRVALGPGGAALFFRQRLRLPELTARALSLMPRRFLRGERLGAVLVECTPHHSTGTASVSIFN